MRKIFTLLLLSGIGITLYTACKKKSDNPPASSSTYTPSALADSLRKTCTEPFVGAGDLASIYLPTAFTPNGDGVNDLYGAISADLLFSNFLLTIYDTTGKLIFQATSATDEWDGTDTATGKYNGKYKFYVEVNFTTTGNKTGSGSTFLYLVPTDTVTHCVNRVAADTLNYEFPDQFNTVSGFDATWPSNEIFCK